MNRHDDCCEANGDTAATTPELSDQKMGNHHGADDGSSSSSAFAQNVCSKDEIQAADDEAEASNAMIEASNPPRSMEENTSEERKEWRGRTLPETLSKVYDFLLHNDTTHEEALKALHRTPYFPVNIRDNYSGALKLLEAATQDLQTATTTTTSVGAHFETNEESRAISQRSYRHEVPAKVSAFDRPQDHNNMSFDQIYPLLSDDYQRCLDEVADDSSEEKRLKFAKQYFGIQAKTEAKFQVSVEKAHAKVAALQASVENEKAKSAALQASVENEKAKSAALQASVENEKAIAKMEKAIAKIKEGIAKIKERGVAALSAMKRNVDLIKNALNYLAGLSQANASTTGSKFGTETKEMIEIEAREGMKDTTAAGESPEHIQQLLRPENIIELPLEDLLRDIEPGRRNAYDKLKKVAGAWGSWVSKSKVVDSKDAYMKDKVKRGIEWMSHHIKDADVDTDGPELDEDLWFPNMVSGEVNAAQPVLMALLSQIGSCLEGWDAPLYGSPSKTQVKQNQIIPPTAHRPKRIADLGVLKPGRFHLLMHDYALKLLVEMKPVVRASTPNPDKLDKESLDQILSHLAKYLSQCLDFHGHGAPSFATGLTATLTHVKVVQLCLDLDSFCPETQTMASLKLRVSNRLPLMTEQSFNEWAHKVYSDQKEPDGIRTLRDSLYGSGKQDVDGEGIPLGLRIIWERMLSRHSENFGPDYQAMFRNSSSNDIDELLGSGTYSVVFGLTEVNRVLKLPRFHFLKHVEKERTILEKLHRNTDPEDHAHSFDNDVALPIFERDRKISLTLGGVHTVTTCLELSPKGIPILGNLTSCFGIEHGIQRNQKISHALKSVAEALDYMHKKGICHNDVNPSNMVLTRAGDVVRIMLVDLSSACGLKDTLVGFLGTPLYAHKDIFEKYPKKSWLPATRYDFFGLALTFCALLNGGKAPWNVDGLPSKKEVLDDKMSERQTTAEDLIKKSGCDEKDMEQWLEWLAADNDITYSVCPGKRKKRG